MAAKNQVPLGLWEVARIFAKIGATAFGGWSTTAMMLEKELVVERGTLPAKLLHGAVTYAQILPGGTQVCITANVGYKLRGLLGAFVATISFLIPGISMIVAFAVAYFHFSSAHLMDHAGGLIAALSGIILANAFKIGGKHATNAKLWILVVAAFTAKLLLHVNALVLIGVFALGGLATSLAVQSKTQEQIHE